MGLRLNLCLGVIGLLSCLAALAQTGGVKTTGDARVRRVLEQTDLRYTVDEDGDFRLSVAVANQRSQLVLISSRTETYGDLESREVWSVGFGPESGVIPPTVGSGLLQANAKLKLGAWQIVSLGGKEAAVFAARIAAAPNVKALRDTIRVVAAEADEKEAELTREDAW
jgi:hypothetical protein